MTTIRFEQSTNLPGAEYDSFTVKRIAQSIRRACDQTNRVRFDPWLAAKRLGIRLRVTPSLKSSRGRLIHSDAFTIIDLRLGELHRTHRFTICHELAHLSFLSASFEIQFGRSAIYGFIAEDRREEHLCDAIATELLMPRRAFRAAAKALLDNAPCGPSIDVVRVLADDFGVSSAAARRRLRELRLRSTAKHQRDIRTRARVRVLAESA